MNNVGQSDGDGSGVKLGGWEGGREGGQKGVNKVRTKTHASAKHASARGVACPGNYSD